MSLIILSLRFFHAKKNKKYYSKHNLIPIYQSPICHNPISITF